MAKITIADGTVFEGTPAEIVEMARAFEVSAVGVVVEEAPALKAGDYITITFGNSEVYDGDITEGKAYEVLSDDGALQFVDDVHDLRIAHIRRGLYTIVDNPEVDPFAQFGKGDKVRLLSGGGVFPLSGYENGEIYEVVNNDDDDGRVGRKIKLKGGNICQAFAEPHQLEKVTDAELAQAEADAEERKRTDVFTANGRKVNEYREGDIVQITGDKCGGNSNSVGDVGEVTETADDGTVRVHVNGKGNRANWSMLSDVEPLVFVENRLDRK